MALRCIPLAALLAGAVAVVACGGSTTNTFPGGGDDSAAGGGTGGAGGGFADDGANGGSGSGGGGGAVTPDSACVTSSAKSAHLPSYLVFMLDRSCSMSDDAKWSSSTAALQGFFSDATTAGLSASLDFFPHSTTSTCASADYTAPAVAMQPLPDTGGFASAISSASLVCGTPTLPALQGALAYADATAAQHGGAKVGVVLVTDGLPDTCSSSVQSVADAASAAAQVHPTYVIGVGSELASLDAIAAAGGTNKAILVATTTPAQIAQQLAAALGQVQASALSCEYTLPAPPPGQSLDPGRVNVVYTPSGGAAGSLAYDASCAGGVGWHYDDATAPTKIVMCPSTCTTLRADPSGDLQILFGCVTSAKVK